MLKYHISDGSSSEDEPPIPSEEAAPTTTAETIAETIDPIPSEEATTAETIDTSQTGTFHDLSAKSVTF